MLKALDKDVFDEASIIDDVDGIDPVDPVDEARIVNDVDGIDPVNLAPPDIFSTNLITILIHKMSMTLTMPSTMMSMMVSVMMMLMMSLKMMQLTSVWIMRYTSPTAVLSLELLTKIVALILEHTKIFTNSGLIDCCLVMTVMAPIQSKEWSQQMWKVMWKVIHHHQAKDVEADIMAPRYNLQSSWTCQDGHWSDHQMDMADPNRKSYDGQFQFLLMESKQDQNSLDELSSFIHSWFYHDTNDSQERDTKTWSEGDQCNLCGTMPT